MITYEFNDFYRLADYCNINWKGSFTPFEVAQNSYDYKVEYDYSLTTKKVTHTIHSLLNLLLEDMGESEKESFSIEDINPILDRFFDEHLI